MAELPGRPHLGGNLDAAIMRDELLSALYGQRIELCLKRFVTLGDDFDALFEIFGNHVKVSTC